MNKKLVLAASVLGLTAIILGAFGAHGLKKILTAEELITFETGVKYQMYHALFLLFLASNTLISESAKKVLFYLVRPGALFFSASIYLLATTSVTAINFSFLGPVTPIGGLLLILAWGKLFVAVFGKK